jgi:uncharacterized protein
VVAFCQIVKALLPSKAPGRLLQLRLSNWCSRTSSTTCQSSVTVTEDLPTEANEEQMIAKTRQKVYRSFHRKQQTVEKPVDEILPRLEVCQSQAAPIASSFVPNRFSPVPWLSNKHVQTIGGMFTRDMPELKYIHNNDWRPGLKALAGKFANGILTGCSPAKYWDIRERVNTPDGDFFHADYKFVSNPMGLVILLHGLEANSNSALTIDIAQAYNEKDLNVVCLNFRGCSGVPGFTLGGYHVGFTDDLKHFLRLHRQRHKILPPLYLSGFSLGGNVVLKALGELGASAVDRYNIQGAAVACPPLDQEREVEHLDKPGFNQMVYCKIVLNSFRAKIRSQLDMLRDLNQDSPTFDYAGVLSAKTIQEFDEAFIKHVYGFGSAQEYRRMSSSIHYLERIAVPTYIIRAADDPILDPCVCPLDKTQEFGGKAPLNFHRTVHGGHLGFAFHQIEGENVASPSTTWLSTELARFVSHVQLNNFENV